MKDYLKEISDLQIKVQDLNVEKKTLEKQREDADVKLSELKLQIKSEFGVEPEALKGEIERLQNEIESELKLINGELNGK